MCRVRRTAAACSDRANGIVVASDCTGGPKGDGRKIRPRSSSDKLYGAGSGGGPDRIACDSADIGFRSGTEPDSYEITI